MRAVFDILLISRIIRLLYPNGPSRGSAGQEGTRMDGICEQCHEYISETNQCLCTHAIHVAMEIDCPWCELDPHEQAEVLEELGLEGIKSPVVRSQLCRA
jgi:hypothetical protein